MLAGGYIAARVNWRVAFMVVGLAGILVAPLVRRIVRDGPKATPAASNSAFATVARTLVGKPSFWLLSFGAASGSMIGYGLAFWLPSLMRRSFGLDLIATSHFLAGLLLVGGVGGILAGGWLADRLGAQDRAWFGYVPAIAYLVSIPLFAGGIHGGDVRIAFALFLLPQALSYAWLGPVLSAVQHLVDPPERATAAALFLLVNNLIGLGGGIYALGALSDALTPLYGTDALRYAMLAGLGLYAVAALLVGLAGPHLRRDWVDRPGRYRTRLNHRHRPPGDRCAAGRFGVMPRCSSVTMFWHRSSSRLASPQNHLRANDPTWSGNALARRNDVQGEQRKHRRACHDAIDDEGPIAASRYQPQEDDDHPVSAGKGNQRGEQGRTRPERPEPPQLSASSNRPDASTAGIASRKE